MFSTGFMANLGVITALARKDDAIFVDAHCHASIFDACRLSGAQISTFRHNDPADLQRLFAESAVPPSQTLVVVEGLYSVHGDLGICRVSRRSRSGTARSLSSMKRMGWGYTAATGAAPPSTLASRTTST